MASPPSPPAPGAVCCMCGDPGLPGELFRCRCCRARLQHSYCSDLYPSPRAAAYRRCNWCLREPQPADQGGRAGHAAAVASKPVEKRKTAAAASDEERGCWPSRRSPPELGGHPVKKKHKAEDKMMMPPPPLAGAGKEIVATDASGSGGKEVMRAGKARVSRVKVRRYKLLAEVISC